MIAMDPAGKRVLVTGASRGIGEAVARAFVGAGASVALVARNEAQLRALASELGDGATVHPTDLLEPAQVATLLHRVEDEAGPVDVVVNNAGIGVPSELWELLPRRAAPFVGFVEAPRRMVELVLTGVPTRSYSDPSIDR